MSMRYKGGRISATAPVTTGGENGSASGAWTLGQQLQVQGAGLWPAQPLPKYVEDVFSTYLYTGTGAAQTITNGIDLLGSGGMLWLKSRSNAYSAWITDSARGVSKGLTPSATSAQTTDASAVTGYTSTGFTLGTDGGGSSNTTGSTQVAWTFRKQPKFFDIVTYTGDGTSNRSISHSLGSVPGCIIIKCTSATGLWFVWHKDLTGNGSTGPGLYLNLTTVYPSDSSVFAQVQGATSISIAPAGPTNINDTGATYVAYIYAHNAGGFGLTGTDNVISCGSYAPDGSGNVAVTLGYEPQWLLFKTSTGVDNWKIQDTMRGASQTTYATLFPNLSDAENAGSSTSYHMIPNATGFTMSGQAAGTYIYIAIRRGPMKVPTDATTVFSPVSTNSSANPLTVTTGFPVSLSIATQASVAGGARYVMDRLRGGSTTSLNALVTTGTNAEITASGYGIGFDNNTAIIDNSFLSAGTEKKVYWNFQRAPGFFDEVCYTGTGSNTTQAHNLGAVPELMIVKNRSAASYNWDVYSATTGTTQVSFLNATNVPQTGATTTWNSTAPTASVFSIGTAGGVNTSGSTYVAYLFATCPGVSKVGSYTGNGSSQTIPCGFAAGARFILIKRTDSTGDWYVWDTARGIITANDPHLSLNTTAAEVTTDDSIDPDVSGFIVNQVAATNINVTSGSYIFLAIA